MSKISTALKIPEGINVYAEGREKAAEWAHNITWTVDRMADALIEIAHGGTQPAILAQEVLDQITKKVVKNVNPTDPPK